MKHWVTMTITQTWIVVIYFTDSFFFQMQPWFSIIQQRRSSFQKTQMTFTRGRYQKHKYLPTKAALTSHAIMSKQQRPEDSSIPFNELQEPPARVNRCGKKAFPVFSLFWVVPPTPFLLESLCGAKLVLPIPSCSTFVGIVSRDVGCSRLFWVRQFAGPLIGFGAARRWKWLKVSRRQTWQTSICTINHNSSW